MKRFIIIAATFLTWSVQASDLSCFMLKVEGREDIALMMATLNRERGIVYKVKTAETERAHETSFYVLALGDKIAKRLYKKYTSESSAFKKYVNVVGAQQHAGKNSCDIYNSVDSDL